MDAAGAIAEPASVAVAAHVTATDPHGDRAFATTSITTHAGLTSGAHGISAFAATFLDDADAPAVRATIGALGGTLGSTANTIGIRGADAATVAAGGGTLTSAGVMSVNSRYLTPDGSASAPGFAFANALTTGVYLSGGSHIGFGIFDNRYFQMNYGGVFNAQTGISMGGNSYAGLGVAVTHNDDDRTVKIGRLNQAHLIAGHDGTDAKLGASTGAVAFSSPDRPSPATVATLPSASAFSGSRIRITDRSNRHARSNGTNWVWADTESDVVS